MYEQAYKPIISEELLKTGIEILPRWINESASIIVKKDKKQLELRCVHTVIYQGTINDLPKEISLEGLNKTKQFELPSLETRKFALRSFCESICEFYPKSLEPEFIGKVLSYRLKNAIEFVNPPPKLIKEIKDQERILKRYGEYKRPTKESPDFYYDNLYLMEISRSLNERKACIKYLDSIGFRDLMREVIVVPTPRTDKASASFRKWKVYSPFGKLLFSFIEWLRYETTSQYYNLNMR